MAKINQEIILPANFTQNSGYNGTKVTWNIDSSFKLPAGTDLTNYCQILKDDKIYLIGPSIIYEGDLITKVWSTTTWTTTIPYIDTATLCGPEQNQIIITGKSYTSNIGYIHVGQFNLATKAYTEQIKVTGCTCSSWWNVDPTYYTVNKNAASFYDINTNTLFFTTLLYVLNRWGSYSYACAYSSNTYTHASGARSFIINSYNLDTNNLESTILDSISETPVYDSSNSAGLLNSLISSYNTNFDTHSYTLMRLSSKDPNLLYLANTTADPSAVKIFDLSSKTTSDATIQLPAKLTSTVHFEDKEIIFNGNVGTVYDLLNDVLIRPAMANTVTSPGAFTLNVWNNYIIFTTPTDFCSLEYFKKVVAPMERPLFWTFFAGQELSGYSEVTLTNRNNQSLTITKEPTVLSEDFSIYVGDYTLDDEYRVLITTSI